MKRITVLIVLLVFLAAGTAAAAPNDVGIIDVERIMAESPKVKTLQAQLNEKARELTQQLEAEKPSLTPEQFTEKQQSVYNKFLEIKKGLEAQVDASIKQAIAQVAKEKKLNLVLYKNSVAYGGIDITADIIAKMQ
jgi:outer membrane protein